MNNRRNNHSVGSMYDWDDRTGYMASYYRRNRETLLARAKKRYRDNRDELASKARMKYQPTVRGRQKF